MYKIDQKFKLKLLLKQPLSKSWYSNNAIRTSLRSNVEEMLEHKLDRELKLKS